MIRFLHEITNEEVGGKAAGLKVLKEIGLNVPGTCVLVHPQIEKLDDEAVKRHLSELGEGPKAVRSSAVSEDGSQVSFAGQFESYLDLHTYEEIKAAIIRCIEAADADRVRAYSGKLLTEADLRISVILQNMVDARVAGVVFSANPVNSRRDQVIINAVAGKGEDLVGGKKDAHQYELFRSGSNIPVEAKKNGPLVSAGQLREILDGTLQAEKKFNRPVDLEWAIGHDGVLQWLQVRPVTSLEKVHYNELDTIKGASNDTWTLGNIGEMMPGVVTPLTWSVSAEAIDYGMTVLASSAGAFRLKDRTTPRYIQMFYNRLFINMSNMMDYPKNVWLNKAEDVQFALSGKVFPSVTASPESILPVRVLNFIRQLVHTSRAGRHLRDLQRLKAGFSIDCTLPMVQLHQALGGARLPLGIGFGYHLGTSAQSGTLYSAFMRIMTGDKRLPTAHDHHIATILLLNIPDIESADAVKSLEKFASLIRSHAGFASLFTSLDPDRALKLIQTESPPEVCAQFAVFLERHGHRCVRESELREKTWEENPLQLIRSIQTSVKIGDVKHVVHDSGDEIKEALRGLPPVKRFILRKMVPAARKAVARREISKALTIKMVSIVRKGYQALARQMEEAGLLDDPDQVYFLTHEELGRLIAGKDPAWKTTASRRRELLPATGRLVFDEISFGIPEPVEPEEETILTGNQLKGTPVSRGVAEGPVRIIHTLDEAEQLREGEIMVAAFTDIGWTPYFSIIGGLITEIGSPLSHGAVVAREYGIPAVVGAKNARRLLRNGERIRLNGDNGVIERVTGGQADRRTGGQADRRTSGQADK